MTELSTTSNSSNAPYAYILGQAVADEAQFQREAYSRVLVTYRSGFYPSMTGLTSDSGFGCMMRSGSMLIGEALQQVIFSRNFIFDREYFAYCPKCIWLTSLISDEKKVRTRHIHPFSVQNIMEKGVEYNKAEGKWFGPGTVANVYAELIKRFAPNPLRIGVYVYAIRLMKQPPGEPETFYEDGLKTPPCPECPIVNCICKVNRLSKEKEATNNNIDVENEKEKEKKNENNKNNNQIKNEKIKVDENQQSKLTDKNSVKEKESVKDKDKILVKDKELKPDQKLENQHCRPILILFPTRLGLKNIAEEYRKVVLRFFTIPQCIGILGGHPNQAHYFFGSRNDNTIIFLDPHKTRTCQEIIVPGTDIYAEEYITANFDRYFGIEDKKENQNQKENQKENNYFNSFISKITRDGSGSDTDRVRSDRIVDIINEEKMNDKNQIRRRALVSGEWKGFLVEHGYEMNYQQQMNNEINSIKSPTGQIGCQNYQKTSSSYQSPSLLQQQKINNNQQQQQQQQNQNQQQNQQFQPQYFLNVNALKLPDSLIQQQLQLQQQQQQLQAPPEPPPPLLSDIEQAIEIMKNKTKENEKLLLLDKKEKNFEREKCKEKRRNKNLDQKIEENSNENQIKKIDIQLNEIEKE